ncbi:MAG: hypothetical protein HKP18_09395 [Acidimicrobiia bacterium]|nr:hypothetical protein [Acidimicrobiia bacterium]
MSNPLTEARKSLATDGGALRCVIPRTRPALSAIKPVAAPPSRRRAARSSVPV